MSELIVIAFDTETAGFDLRAELVRMQDDYLIDMEDVVVVTRHSETDLKLHQAMNLTAAGAVGGGFWGTLVGMVFMNPLLGAAVGAASGALAGLATDVGINDQFMKDVANSVPPGGSAVFVLLRKMTADKMMEALSTAAKGGRILQTSLTNEQEGQLRNALAGDQTATGASA